MTAMAKSISLLNARVNQFSFPNGIHSEMIAPSVPAMKVNELSLTELRNTHPLSPQPHTDNKLTRLGSNPIRSLIL